MINGMRRNGSALALGLVVFTVISAVILHVTIRTTSSRGVQDFEGWKLKWKDSEAG